MGTFNGGVSVNTHHRVKKLKHLRIKAGPQRDEYVHSIVFEAKILGRREAWELIHPDQPIPDLEFFRYLQPHETVDHDNNDSLDNSPDNLKRMTRADNTRKALAHRRAKKKEAESVPF